MKNILFGPIHYFERGLYFKGIIWFVFIILGFIYYVWPGVVLWLLSGWIGRKSRKDTKQELNQSFDTSELPEHKISNDFSYTDNNGMKILKILDGVKLSGVTKEVDGINPQDIIPTLNLGDEVFFERVYMDEYPHATLVIDKDSKPVGWIPESFSYQEDIAKRIDDGTTVKALVHNIYGGKDGKSYGVTIDIARYEKKRTKS